MAGKGGKTCWAFCFEQTVTSILLQNHAFDPHCNFSCKPYHGWCRSNLHRPPQTRETTPLFPPLIPALWLQQDDFNIQWMRLDRVPAFSTFTLTIGSTQASRLDKDVSFCGAASASLGTWGAVQKSEDHSGISWNLIHFLSQRSFSGTILHYCDVAWHDCRRLITLVSVFFAAAPKKSETPGGLFQSWYTPILHNFTIRIRNWLYSIFKSMLPFLVGTLADLLPAHLWGRPLRSMEGSLRHCWSKSSRSWRCQSDCLPKADVEEAAWERRRTHSQSTNLRSDGAAQGLLTSSRCVLVVNKPVIELCCWGVTLGGWLKLHDFNFFPFSPTHTSPFRGVRRPAAFDNWPRNWHQNGWDSLYT